MREWKGFGSDNPKDILQQLDKQLREFGAAIRKLNDGKVPNATGNTLVLKDPQLVPSASGIVGNPSTSFASFEDIDTPSISTFDIYEQALPEGMYRVSVYFKVRSIAVPNPLTIDIEYNGTASQRIIDEAAINTGDEFSGSCMLYSAGTDPLTFNGSLSGLYSVDYRIKVESL